MPVQGRFLVKARKGQLGTLRSAGRPKGKGPHGKQSWLLGCGQSTGAGTERPIPDGLWPGAGFVRISFSWLRVSEKQAVSGGPALPVQTSFPLLLLQFLGRKFKNWPKL